MEQLVGILLPTLNYKALRKERKRKNSGHQEVGKAAKTSFPFLFLNSQSDDQFNSEASRHPKHHDDHFGYVGVNCDTSSPLEAELREGSEDEINVGPVAWSDNVDETHPGYPPHHQ